MKNEFDELFEQAREGTLPPDFDRWEIARADGWSVAHMAAFRGRLPPDFDRWELANEAGVTVLEVYAKWEYYHE